jgi:hypothetical protein
LVNTSLCRRLGRRVSRPGDTADVGPTVTVEVAPDDAGVRGCSPVRVRPRLALALAPVPAPDPAPAPAPDPAPAPALAPPDPVRDAAAFA